MATFRPVNSALANAAFILTLALGPGACDSGGGGSAEVVCGDGVVDAPEVCDDGNALAGDGCNANCTSDESCGNGILDLAAGEACDDGNTADGDGCQAGCALPTCGDGVTDRGEVCDDGNTLSGDGCSASCASDESCGNGILDVAAGEACDDGNREDGDGCQASCALPRCGDGVVDPWEACDDGGHESGDGCNANCTSDESCGNGVMDVAVGEQCEDGNNESCDGCRADCLAAEFGCGDGSVCGDEVCDDGNRDDGDGCSADCASDETCPNGLIDRAVGEECEGDDLDQADCTTVGDWFGGVLTCASDCHFDESGCNLCGNDQVDDGEECDGPDLAEADCATVGDWFGGLLGCTADCRFDESGCSLCGNGQVDDGEECDGDALNDQDCLSLGQDYGQLACASDCRFDLADCGACGAGCPDGFWDRDGDSLTGSCGCEYACEFLSAADPVDPAYVDQNCDGSDGVLADCVFVSASLGVAGAAGTRAAPLPTIAEGIAAAVDQDKPAVCVSGELYTEQVLVQSGIDLYGGFDQADPDFPFLRKDAAVTTVQHPGTVFLAAQIDQPTRISGFAIEALDPGIDGESTYGLRLLDGSATLTLDGNTIACAAGRAGADGDDGTPWASSSASSGNNGKNGCPGTGCQPTGGLQPNCVEYGGKGGDGGYESGSGQNGWPGTGNAAVGIGGGTDMCFIQSDNGTDGGAVTVDGAAGGPGAGGADLGALALGLYLAADGGAGGPGGNGKGGSGGGGGGGGPTIGGMFCNPDTGGGGGSGGCGGLGGPGGQGGQGGGASFGVFATGGILVATGNEIVVSGGGQGGAGGAGAPGQYGGSGGTGGASEDDSGAGGNGGAGSDGGAGGPGGGGGGGPNACVAHVLAVDIVGVNDNTCVVGAPGLGGAGGPGAPAGQTGLSAAILQLE